MTAAGDQDEALRFGQWLELVERARPWLGERFGLDLTGTPEDLVPLWTAAMPVLAYAPPDEPYEALPAWARWPEVVRPGRIVGALSAATVEVVGALAAYHGELLRAAAPPPGVRWEVLHHPPEPFADEGRVVLARPPDASGYSAGWVNPLNDLFVAAGRQLREPLAPGEPVVGKDDPHRLRWLFYNRLAALS
ncbi:hypothetical protein [Cellulomonas sp. NS3]|uniref:hypothetical protein n=1 Tax=Cellulomonas sp. NS3 TaxID=2973977 RepID=UPI0021632AEF|nr:hypothetical protein [Cellulomonas sp. NS3]